MADTTLPADISEAPSLEIAAERLGHMLGLSEAAPLAATRHALAEPLYARALLSTRKLPALRDRFLAQPEQTRLRETQPSSVAIAGKAARSVLKWGMDGLRPAAPWIIERRLAACRSCEFQIPAPETLLYRGARVAVGKDARICRLCHCLTNTKAAISTEKCPAKDPASPSLSRWGEPWVPQEEHPDGPW